MQILRKNTFKNDLYFSTRQIEFGNTFRLHRKGWETLQLARTLEKTLGWIS